MPDLIPSRIHASQVPGKGTGLFTAEVIEAGNLVFRIDRSLLCVPDNDHLDKTCYNCFLTDATTKLKTCMGCKVVRYCSQASGEYFDASEPFLCFYRSCCVVSGGSRQHTVSYLPLLIFLCVIPTATLPIYSCVSIPWLRCCQSQTISGTRAYKFQCLSDLADMTEKTGMPVTVMERLS